MTKQVTKFKDIPRKSIGEAEYKFISQKAKGVRTLSDSYSQWFNEGTEACQQTSVYREGVLYPFYAEANKTLDDFPFFARPCPERPRHGFVDSRPVFKEKDWQDIIQDIEGSDEPQCEVLIMPLLHADWSAIMTGAGVVIGPGNDGATSGHESISIPATSGEQDLLYRVTGKGSKSLFACEDSPYIELVHGKLGGESEKRTHVVQVRDGPKIVLRDAFIPEQFEVKNIVLAEGDLIEWETKATKFPEGTLVWHPGGNLSSHYAVHCALNNVPVVCRDAEPKIGDVLEPVDGPPALEPEDYEYIAQQIPVFYRAVANDLTEGREGHGLKEWAKLAVAGLHANVQWGNEVPLLRLRAASLAAMFFMSQAAVVGEARHWRSSGPGRMNTPQLCPGIPEGYGRHDMYEKVADMAVHDLATKVRLCYYDFLQNGWSASYGGKNWGNCAHATMRLGRCIMDFMKSPVEDNWKKAVMAWNNVVNVAHNGGKFLNKFLSNDLFDLFAVAPVFGFVGETSWKVLIGAYDSEEGWASKQVNLIARIFTLQKKGKTYPVPVKEAILKVFPKWDGEDNILASLKENSEAAIQAMKEAQLKEQKEAEAQHKKALAEKKKAFMAFPLEAAAGIHKDATARLAGHNTVKVQVVLEKAWNRKYGFTFNLGPGIIPAIPLAHLVKKLQEKPHEVTSHAGSDTPYAKVMLGIANDGSAAVLSIGGFTVKLGTWEDLKEIVFKESNGEVY